MPHGDHKLPSLEDAEKKLKQLKTAVKPKAETVKRSLTAKAFVVSAVKTCALVLFYYTFSIGLTFYNQRFIKHFKFPLSLTMAHLVVKFIMAALIRLILQLCTKKERVTLSWSSYSKRIAPAGIASALDIGLSNWSWEFITVSLYTMSKSSAVLFILLFALIFKLEKWRWSLSLVVFLISLGLFLFTYHSTQFNMTGFVMVMTASVLSGLRWTLAQLVTQKNEIGLHNPLDMMYHIQPWMILGLLPLSAAFEGVKLATSDQFFRYYDSMELMRNLGLVLFGATLAFLLEFSEFLLVSQTSSLTLSISGIFKECAILYLAHILNNDTMKPINGLGLVICLAGIGLHVIIKAVHDRQDRMKNEHVHIEEMEMLTADGSGNLSDGEDEEVFNVRHRVDR